MAAALPVTKLAGLLVKTLAKPLSKRIKYDFSRFDATKRMLICIGQTNHTVTSYMTIWSSGYKVKSIKPIEPDKAMIDGAEFVGEAFVLTISASIVIFEYNRSAQKQAQKTKEKRERLISEQKALQSKLRALDVRLKAIEDLIKQQQNVEDKGILGRAVTVTKPKYVAPPDEELVPIVDDDSDSINGVSTLAETKEPELEPTDNKIVVLNSIESSKRSSWWKFW